jgi:hypothetical protein
MKPDDGWGRYAHPADPCNRVVFHCHPLQRVGRFMGARRFPEVEVAKSDKHVKRESWASDCATVVSCWAMERSEDPLKGGSMSYPQPESVLKRFIDSKIQDSASNCRGTAKA